jgi:MscS family membrane protein
MLESFLPAPLLQSGPLKLAWWQWIALPVGLAVAIFLGKAAGYVTRRILIRISRHTARTWHSRLIALLAGPITLLWTIVFAYLIKLAIDLPESAERHVDVLLRTAAVATFFWAGLRSIDVAFQGLVTVTSARAYGLGEGLLQMLRKASKIALFVIAVTAILTDLGYPAASLLAGLGIGGLALALAAQKTVENLFGSVSISIDQPFRLGDYVKLESGVSGTVEAIGLRSTRIRTLDRTVVTIPNGKLADQRVESFAPRDRCRFSCTLTLVHRTTAAQLRAVVERVEALLQTHPRAWPDGIGVKFVAIGASSLDVDVYAWFATSDWIEFQTIRQEVLLSILEIVEQAGTALAYPSQTIRVERTDEERGARG